MKAQSKILSGSGKREDTLQETDSAEGRRSPTSSHLRAIDDHRWKYCSWRRRVVLPSFLPEKTLWKEEICPGLARVFIPQYETQRLVSYLVANVVL